MSTTTKGKGDKVGRNKEKCAHYKTMRTREKNKIKRILRSSGFAQAQNYAVGKGMDSYLNTLVKARDE